MENVFHHGVAFGKQSKDYTEISGKLSKDSIERFDKKEEQKSNYNEPEYTGNDWANERLAAEKEQTKEITTIINRRCGADLGQVHANSKDGKVTKTVDTSLIAKDIIDAGYHKTIWHSVADGDLPEDDCEVRFVSDTGYHHNGCFVKAHNAFYEDGDIKYDIDEVVAWTELPTYKE